MAFIELKKLARGFVDVKTMRKKVQNVLG